MALPLQPLEAQDPLAPMIGKDVLLSFLSKLTPQILANPPH
jgi:hypothetical protein